jgi:endonuclease G, mitochondrial
VGTVLVLAAGLEVCWRTLSSPGGVVQIPRQHWEVVVYRLDGQLRFKCFILTQNLDDVGERAAVDFLDDFDTYLVPLDLLEHRAGLEFPSLRDLPGPADLRRAGPVLVADPEHVPW